MRSNYSLFKNNSAARSARLNKQEEGIETNRPDFRRSNLAGSAALAIRLADEERKRRQAQSEAPAAGEQPEFNIEANKQISMGLRVGGGKRFERANPPEPDKASPTPQPAATEPAASSPEEKSGLGATVSKLFSFLGGHK